MTLRLWHQSFTVLEDLPDYAATLKRHFARVASPGTEVVMHGMHAGTYTSEYPGTDIRHAALQHLHATQFMLGGLAAEQAGFDAYMICTIPDPVLTETRSLLRIPVVGYGESAMLVACMLGRRFGILNFIEEIGPQLEANARRYGLGERLAAVRHVGFGFHDVAPAFTGDAAPVIERFTEAARAMIRLGADVIIPGEAVLCVLLASQGVHRVDGVPIVDALAVTVRMAEMMAGLRRVAGLEQNRTGYFTERPEPGRVEELVDFYGLRRLVPGSEA